MYRGIFEVANSNLGRLVRRDSSEVKSVDKAVSADKEQINKLPPELKNAIIHGSEEEARKARLKIKNLQDKGGLELGEAALELLHDMRQIAAQH